ncbi:MAG TPA: saccharopine dehydrogenase C-terminal domain-containing protein [Candidatus Bathyarchaeia archaeon]|nr:saccharopine dehydrogenase C-terminal domain-containing protein [Candidatus Bathyarchaeia archaeon]
MIFGAGLMGSTIAYDLVKSREVEEVTLCDVDVSRLTKARREIVSPKLRLKKHDVRRRVQTVDLLRRSDVGIGALPYDLCEYSIKATLAAAVDYVDLIYGWRYEHSSISRIAERRGITIIPACGLAPGLSNVLAWAAADQLDSVREVHIKTGGIPERPKPPLNYRIVFSFEAVLEEYLRKARIVRNGRITDVEALSGLEQITFPRPIGRCECFYTDGLSSLIQTIRHVKEMDEKTIRWPGHVAQIKTLIESGVLDTKPITHNGHKIIPRKFTAQILSDRLSLRNEKDLTLLRVDVKGKKNGKIVRSRYNMIDHFDSRNHITSMARTTSYPCAAAALLLGTSRIGVTGLVPPEIAFETENRDWLLSYLTSRGIRIKST